MILRQLRRGVSIVAFLAACHGERTLTEYTVPVTPPADLPSPRPDLTALFATIHLPAFAPRSCNTSTECQYRIATADLTGNNRTLLIPSPSEDIAQPSLSPQGDLITFNYRTGTIANPNFQLAYYRADNFRIGVLDLAGVRRQLVGEAEMFSAAHPSFSVDGKYVYFTGRVTAESTGAVWRIGVDGAGLVKIAEVPHASVFLVGPAVSSDGSAIVYSDTLTWDVKVLSVSTGRTVSVAKGLKGAFGVFSPDGARVAFLEFQDFPFLTYDQRSRVTIASVDGSWHKRVGTSEMMSWRNRLSWTKDGNWVLGRTTQHALLVSATNGEEIVMGASGDLYQLALP